MRDFLNAILAHIGSESLTDIEFDSIELESQTYTKETYTALRDILEEREDVSNQKQKLCLYFKSRGVDLSDAPKPYVPKSNIFIGTKL